MGTVGHGTLGVVWWSICLGVGAALAPAGARADPACAPLAGHSPAQPGDCFGACGRGCVMCPSEPRCVDVEGGQSRCDYTVYHCQTAAGCRTHDQCYDDCDHGIACAYRHDPGDLEWLLGKRCPNTRSGATAAPGDCKVCCDCNVCKGIWTRCIAWLAGSGDQPLNFADDGKKSGGPCSGGDGGAPGDGGSPDGGAGDGGVDPGSGNGYESQPWFRRMPGPPPDPSADLDRWLKIDPPSGHLLRAYSAPPEVPFTDLVDARGYDVVEPGSGSVRGVIWVARTAGRAWPHTFPTCRRFKGQELAAVVQTTWSAVTPPARLWTVELTDPARTRHEWETSFVVYPGAGQVTLASRWLPSDLPDGAELWNVQVYAATDAIHRDLVMRLLANLAVLGTVRGDYASAWNTEPPHFVAGAYIGDVLGARVSPLSPAQAATATLRLVGWRWEDPASEQTEEVPVSPDEWQRGAELRVYAPQFVSATLVLRLGGSGGAPGFEDQLYAGDGGYGVFEDSAWGGTSMVRRITSSPAPPLDAADPFTTWVFPGVGRAVGTLGDGACKQGGHGYLGVFRLLRDRNTLPLYPPGDHALLQLYSAAPRRGVVLNAETAGETATAPHRFFGTRVDLVAGWQTLRLDMTTLIDRDRSDVHYDAGLHRPLYSFGLAIEGCSGDVDVGIGEVRIGSEAEPTSPDAAMALDDLASGAPRGDGCTCTIGRSQVRPAGLGALLVLSACLLVAWRRRHVRRRL